MLSFQELTGQARTAALRSGYFPAQNDGQEKFIVEDGWVFREHHGKYVECICRSEDLPAIPAYTPSVLHIA
jgi:hypothetical protein